MKWKALFLTTALWLLGSSVAFAQDPPDPPVTNYTVTVVDSIIGSTTHGGGTVTGGGTYASGATVTLTATAADGYTFVGWRDYGINENPRVVTVMSDTTFYAIFFESGINILGSVYGGGEGSNATVETNTSVSLYDGLVATNLYGGGALGQVNGNASVTMTGGEVGAVEYAAGTVTHTHGNLTGADDYSGHLFGGGKGSDTDSDDGRVLGNSTVAMSGGHVYFNVYGGGEMGSVGQRQITYLNNDPTSAVISTTPLVNTGLASVTITGGQVGPAPNSTNNVEIALNGQDGYVFGGGKGKGLDPDNQWKLFGDVNSTSVTINIPANADVTENRIWGSVFGGAEDGHVLGDANVYYYSGLTGTKGTTGYDGNIFGGGRNYSRKNYTAGRVGGNVNITMTNGQIYGSIFGAGRLSMTGAGVNGFYQRTDGRYGAMLDGNDHGKVTINVSGGTVGNESLITQFTTYSMGDVFGGGKGHIDGIDVLGHPAESPLLVSLCKNTDVTITGSARILGSVFGGGEVANVGNYTWEMPDATTIQNIGVTSDGLAKITISGNAIIGIDDMQMNYVIADGAGNYNLKYNYDLGHVFGGGEGIVGDPATYDIINAGTQGHNNVPLIDLMATVDTTSVTITGSAFVKGSVYGGAENGHVIGGTYVKVEGGQIGCGEGTNDAYAESAFINPLETEVTTTNALAECPHWDYDPNTNYPFDPIRIKDHNEMPSDGKTYFGNVFGGGSGYYPYVKLNTTTNQYETHWNPKSGIVEGNTKVEIEGGHILTSVYGGCEVTDVLGSATVIMSGGTLGVPRTDQQMKDHPVTCYLFGAGKGDSRDYFNQWTNVASTDVQVSGGTIYGSVFGGGEEGHVLGDAVTSISQAQNKTTIIGTSGTSYVDGNVFGGGRGFSGEALTAGVVCGDVSLTITGGTMLGSIYGGGRLASVGTYLVEASNPNYGKMRPDKTNESHGHITLEISGGTIGNDKEAIYQHKAHNIGGNVFGGSMGRLELLDGTTTNPNWPYLAKVKDTDITISQTSAKGTTIKGNVYGGSELGFITTDSNHLDTIPTASTSVTVDGGTIWGNVFGGSYGSDNTTKTADITITLPGASSATTYSVSPMKHAGNVMGNTQVNVNGGWIKKNIYGGGEFASVGFITSATEHPESGANAHPFHLSWPCEFTFAAGTGEAEVNVTGGRIGITGEDFMGPWVLNPSNVLVPADENGNPISYTNIDDLEDYEEDNGDIYGGCKGVAGDRFAMAYLANVKQATINIDYPATLPTGQTAATPQNFKPEDDIIVPYYNMEDWSNYTSIPCVVGAVYGGGENGHVNENTYITLNNGLVGHAVYGGGKGKDKYKDASDNKVYSYTAGKVYGNTNITVNGGNVVRSVFGGGNLASVGKGNYNKDSYAPGMGEETTDATLLALAKASGHTYVNIYGGTLGKLDPTHPDEVFKDTIPFGSVFGGSRGKVDAALNDPTSILSHLGFVNYTHVTIGGTAAAQSPTVLGSVYGGAQDGHVRHYTNVLVQNGEIGVEYQNATHAQTIMGNSDPSSLYWYDRGNVYGGGSGQGVYKSGSNKLHSRYAGSVMEYSKVTIDGGTIHRHVYGGGNMSSVGPEVVNGTDCTSQYSCDTVTINSAVGVASDVALGYGGNVFGGGRGNEDAQSDFDPEVFSGSVFTLVNINTGADVKGNVYGGGALGQVRQSTDVNINDGFVRGDVFGSGRGSLTANNYACVKVSTDVEMIGGQVFGNVFGGGQIASVGTFSDGGGGVIVCTPNTGTATVKVTGGIVGSDNLYSETDGTYTTVASYYNHHAPAITDKGHVFGGGKGESDNTHLLLCDVNNTQVTIGTSGQTSGGPQIYGSVFGGAADGHVLGNTDVTFHSGTIGQYGLSSWDGHIFGGGQGSGLEETTGTGSNAVTTFTLYKHCGRVGGNPTITMDGGALLGSIYGGGRLGMTGVDQNGNFIDKDHGKVTIEVSGGTLGNHNNNGYDLLESDFSIGDIFGSGRGDVDYYQSVTAGCVTNSEINVSGNPTIYGSVFGGGEMASLGYKKLDNGKFVFETGTGHADITIGGSPTIGTPEEYTYDKPNPTNPGSNDNPGQWTIYNDDGTLFHTCTGNVFGGSQGDVDIESPKWVSLSASNSAKVTINGGTIMSGVFGGPEQGTMAGDAEVVINQTDNTKPTVIGTIVNQGQSNEYLFGHVFGGGYGSDDPSDNITTVNDSTLTADLIAGHVYGDVSTKVLGGTVQGDVFGGAGLAYIGYGSSTTKGNVTLNIGDVDLTDPTNPVYSGEATILGNVYGANNQIGTPLGNVNLNIYKTAHTTTNAASYSGTDATFAINQVFGGGNLADYAPTPVDTRTVDATTTVHVYTCDNTIKEVYGGGNSADVGTTTTSANTHLIIDGGRYDRVFGGGNGPVSTSPANIYGIAYTDVYGGVIRQLFGGSNQNGSITQTNMLVDENSICPTDIEEIYGGSNEGDIAGDVTTTVACGDGVIDYLYGGALNANITGNVTLNVYGNTITDVYGGSWGTTRDANIGGNVNLNLYGGTITNAFGGSNQRGNVAGIITVNVLDYGDNACPLDITDLYGGCNQATHNTTINSSPIKDSPVVNVMHLKEEHSIHGNVYGGSLGASAVVTANPTVNIGYDASNSYLSTTLTGLVPTTWTQPASFRAVIGGNTNAGNVYGGGNAAAITGNTTVNIRNSNTRVLGNVFAAGKGSSSDKDVAKITGNTNLNVYDGSVNGSIFGGGAIASITGKATVTLEGGTIGHDAETTPKSGNVYGGGQGLAEIDDVNWTNVNETEVNFNGGHAFGSLFGGGENGHVITNTQVNMTSGIIGGHYDNGNLVVCTNHFHGNVYGGGRGIDEITLGTYSATAGKVLGNTNIHISGGTVYRNVYGGGSMASVGTLDANNQPVNGLATVIIDGGQIGIDGGVNYNTDDNSTYGYDNGHVFGSSRGLAGSGYSQLANVNTTSVTIGGTAYVTGSVFGSGENGHVKGNSLVTVNASSPATYFDNEGVDDDNIEPYPVIGTPLTAAEMVENVDDPVMVYRGNVYGGGRGIDHVGNGTELSKTAGVVYGNTEVIIHGGTIRHEVFGGGSMASVGTLTYDPTTGAVTGIASGSGLAKVTIDGGIIGMSPALTVTKIMDGVNVIGTRSGSNNGLVFGSGRGAAGTLYKDLAFVDTTYVHVDGGLVCGAVFGGGNNGHVKKGTRVDITNGTIGSPLTTTEMVEHNPGSNEANQIIYRGNVYGGGRGIDHDAMNAGLSATAGKVYGNTTVNVSGGKVYHDVFGGGSLANVGVEDDDNTGHTHVNISGTARIGMSPEEAQTAGNIECTGLNNGYVYGSGRGEAGTEYADHAYVKYTHVTVTGNSKIYGAVFGGGANGHVRKDTEITISGGEIGTDNSHVAQGITALYRGNVYGGGRGIDTDDNNIVSPTAGWVQGNTSISIEDGKIFHNVYGGGSLATVGEFTTDPTTGIVTGWTSGGTTTIDITGGQIGIDGNGNGRVFGAGRGMAGSTTIGTQTIDFSHLTFVKETNVNVKPGADIKGSVYGSGDNGHTWTDTHVTMTGGTIGTNGGDLEGNIFGGGRGQDTYGNGSMSATAGKVFGDTYVNMSAGQIKANVYGGGNVSSVAGTTYVTIEGMAQVGASTYPEGGNVFGACRGGASYDHTFATVSNTVVEIKDATVTVQNNVYGGGQMGWVSETTDVTIDGATVHDVYGAGMGVLHTPPTVGSNDDVGISTLVTLEDGTVNGSIYGGGQNGSVGFDAPTGTTATSTVNVNGGTVIQNVYGGGEMGFTKGNTFVNMSGGEVKNHVFGGAFGAINQVYVKGLHTVNMRGGLVKGNVYGGSCNGDDAIDGFYTASSFSGYTGTDHVCVVNYSGGHTEHHVFGSGYRGRTYGSSFVFVGTNAIMNAPYNTFLSTDPTYNAPFYNDHEDLVIDRDVWAGADYGDYDPNVNTEFGLYTVTGRSDVYIDGLGYDTENGASQGDDTFMILRNSVFGCGTLNDGGHQGKRILVRNYGHLVGSGTGQEPWTDATRTLHSIQYADSVIVESSHIHFEGRGIVEDFGTTEKYALYSVFNDVRLVNGSSLFIDKPIKNISNLHSNVCADVYAATPTYTEVGYADLNPTYINDPSLNGGKDNKIRINKGTYVSVTQYDAANHRFDYGALKGFMFLMTDGPYNAFAYARPKQSTETGNIITTGHMYNDDGGFVSYQPSMNIYDVNGGLISGGNSIQMRYENHTPNQRDYQYDQYFRVWRFKDTNAQSTFDVVLHATSVLDASGNPIVGFSNYAATLDLPAQQGSNSYYRIKNDGNVAEINYGTELKMVTVGMQESGTNPQWMYYYKDNNNVESFVYDQAESNVPEDQRTYMHSFPNNAFGLTVIPQGGFLGGSNNNNKPMLLCQEANNPLVASQWTNMDISTAPQVEFLLTHSDQIDGNFTWDPLSITLEQVKVEGGTEIVTDEVTVNVTITTSTRLEQTNKLNTYAIMTHPQGTGNPTDIFKARVLIPSYQLYESGTNIHSNWTLTGVEWEPAAGFNSSTLVGGQPALAGVTPTKDFVGMTICPALNLDNVNGWWNANLNAPIDLGSRAGQTFTPVPLGSADGVNPISFDFDLLFDGNQKIPESDNAFMGTVKVTAQVTNYKNGTGTDHVQDVHFEVKVYRRGKGKGFYIDGVDGNFAYSGKRPNAAQPSLAGILYFAEDYEPVDTIYVVNKITANSVSSLDWRTPFVPIRVTRYNGGHPLFVPLNATDNTPYYTGYGENPLHNINQAYKGALIDVVTSMNISSAIINGAYEMKEMDGNYNDSEGHLVAEHEVAPHVLAEAPLINILGGGTLAIEGSDDQMRLCHNYNNAGNGGAANIASGGTLKMNKKSFVEQNYVEDGTSAEHHGGGIYMADAANMLVSDSVFVEDNSRVSGSTPIVENVYISGYNTVISVGTMEDKDTYGPLHADSRIGVTKIDWDNKEYMPVIYAENFAHANNLLNGNIIFDQMHKYTPYEYPERFPNGDHDYLNKLYWVRTWVSEVTSNPMAPDAFDPSNIDTPEKLAWAISIVNGLNGCSGSPSQSFTITKDIDMSQYIWVPIGDVDASTGYAIAYTGTFEGNGHLVSGIHSPFSMGAKGMFGYTGSAANICNLQAVVDFYKGEAQFLGGIVGHMSGGTLSNCESAGYLEAENYVDNSGSTPVIRPSYIGGLVGVSTGGTIHSSFATDTLCGKDASIVMGGLVADNTGLLLNAYSRVLVGDGNQTAIIGGLVGNNNSGSLVENCYADVQGFPAFAYTNNGTIQYCYANAANANNYYHSSTVDLTGHGTFSAPLGRKEIGYMYDDNKVTLTDQNNDYVIDKISYDNAGEHATSIVRWPGMLSTLNEWVKEKNTSGTGVYAGKNFTSWFRPTTVHVNADLPVLGFPKDNAMATLDVDGRFLQYSATSYDATFANEGDNGLDGLLQAYTDKTASIFLYNNAVSVKFVPSDDVKVFINEDAVLTQHNLAGDFINTTVGITFDNSGAAKDDQPEDYFGNKLTYDWHLMSTPLGNAKMGTTYGHCDSNFNYTPDEEHVYQESPVDITSMVDSYFPNGLTMGSGYDDAVMWDFYNFFEPEYHWINLKRNKVNHFHRDAHEGMWLDGVPYQLDATYADNFRHYQIDYDGEDQSYKKADSGADDGCFFTPGKGYMMAISKESYMSSTGTLNKNVEIQVTAEGDYDKGCNLVGNPYQAYLNLDEVSKDEGGVSVNPGLDKFWVYDADKGVYEPYTKGASQNSWIPSQFIHPHQGFFVLNNSGSPQTMMFTSSMAGTLKDEASYFRKKVNYPLVNLIVTDESGDRDLTIVEVDRPETGGVRKVESLLNADFKLYTHFEDENYGLLFAPRGTERIPLFFKTPNDGTYTLDWNTLHGDFSEMWLIDNITGEQYDMLANDHYTFKSYATDYAARFYIVFSLSDNQGEENDNFAFNNGTGWVIDGEGVLELVDVLGHVLYSDYMSGRGNVVNFGRVAAGVYTLRLGDRTQKIVITRKVK